MKKFYNFNPDFCPDLMQYQIPLFLTFQAVIGKKYSVTYKNKLMTILICSTEGSSHRTIYWVKVLEYPAKKVVK